MENDTEREDGTLYGNVKWFDPGKGFGFIVVEDHPNDILLHANVLRNYGQNSIADGAGVEIVVQHTDRGVQAVEVVHIDPPELDDMSGLQDMNGYSAEEIAELDLIPARIKWFDKVKGFGFANGFASSEDIFVHVEVLRRSGLSDLMPGEAVALRVIEGERGKMAITVSAWETAQREGI